MTEIDHLFSGGRGKLGNLVFLPDERQNHCADKTRTLQR